jgi:NAD-dependent deacetylase
MRYNSDNETINRFERSLTMAVADEQIKTLSTWIRESKWTTVLTGAGMSTESGIPDFRSKNGLWRNVDPRTVATVEALNRNYEFFREFYQHRINALGRCRPNRGHYILAEWEKHGRVHTVATQNVDGFHIMAGNKQVHELHGSIRSARCDRCQTGADMEAFMEGDACISCGGKLRPNVVLFGEALPEEAWEKALQAIQKSELVMVIGTSLQVYPVNELPFMTSGKIVLINAEPTGQENQFDITLFGRASEILKQLDEALRGDWCNDNDVY